MKFKQVEFEGTAFIAPSWNEMGEVVFELARQILEADKKYDRVVALAKGGWTWARTLVDYLGIDELDSVRIRFYEGINKTLEKPVITQALDKNIGGENILIFDDVTDKGTTLEAAKDYLFSLNVKYLETAALFYKPNSKLKPDFFGVETPAWIVFPHEIREFIEETSKKWRGQGLGVTEVKQRYLKLALDKKQVDYFVDKLYNQD